jgi:sulfatase modifying factor 1
MRPVSWNVVVAIVFMLAGANLTRATPVNYEMVRIVDAGNAADSTGYGAVAYEYQIGKYDVTIGQYTAFLNAVDPGGTNPYSLYNSSMGTELSIAGISFTSGAADGCKYAVISGSENKPITYVSWFDAARFANWMQNGQGSGSTETGAYTLVGGQTSGTAPARNAGALFLIPTENEWYKAAFYDPTKSGAGGYWTYATRSDTAPGNIIGGLLNQANYITGAGWCVTQSGTGFFDTNFLTDVGAFTASASFYGTFDQSGLVWQWNDLGGSSGPFRGARGGDWFASAAWLLSSSVRETVEPSYEEFVLGFRLAGPAAVPEIDFTGMGSVLAFVAGTFCLFERRRA